VGDGGITLTEPPDGGDVQLKVIGCAGIPSGVLTAEYRLTP
jgi:hypothetical protein